MAKDTLLTGIKSRADFCKAITEAEKHTFKILEPPVTSKWFMPNQEPIAPQFCPLCEAGLPVTIRKVGRKYAAKIEKPARRYWVTVYSRKTHEKLRKNFDWNSMSMHIRHDESWSNEYKKTRYFYWGLNPGKGR